MATKKPEEDPTEGWSDERIVREYIDFAERSADDSGPTGSMANQARTSLRALVAGTGSTDAEAALVEAMAKIKRVHGMVSALVNPKTTKDDMIEANRVLVAACEDLRVQLDAAGSNAKSKLREQIQRAKNEAAEAIQRIAAHLFR